MASTATVAAADHVVYGYGEACGGGGEGEWGGGCGEGDSGGGGGGYATCE